MSQISIKWTKEKPFESAQIVLQDDSGRLFFHKNSSIVKWQVCLTLYWGKVEEWEKWFIAAIREIKEELGITVLPDNLSLSLRDGPLSFEKGWFLSLVYLLNISKELWDDILEKNTDIQEYHWFDHFLNSAENEKFWTSFAHMKILISKVLEWK